MADTVMTDIPPEELTQLLDDLRYEGFDAMVSRQDDGLYTVRTVGRAATAAVGGGAGEQEAGDDGEETPTGTETGVGPPPPPARVTAPDPGTEGGNLVLTEAHLIALWKRSLFPIAEGRIIVFGIRGCLPVDYAGTPPATSQPISLASLDYRTMRCMLGQWRPGGGFALFPGSTVPYGATVAAAAPGGGKGVNQLGRGRYPSYVPDWHKRSEGQNGHWALLQDCAITLQRTADDADYDLADSWDVGRIAGDNIHCAFGMGPGAAIPDARYSSAGCQVVAGTVRKGVAGSERGPWAKFIAPFRRGGGQPQTEYVLFDGLEVQQMIRSQCRGKTVILRMGSRGDLVATLQRRLQEKLGRPIDANGAFGSQTFQAVIDFQARTFGPNSDDGIVGPDTAHELGFELPGFDFSDAIGGGSGLVEPAGGAVLAGAAAPQGARAAGGPAAGEPAIAWGAFAEAKAGPGFKREVLRIAAGLGCDPNSLMAVMAFESGASFAPDKPNAAGSGAVGLIQFTPRTAKWLGTSTAALAGMTAVQQLAYVEKYLRNIKGRRSFSTLSDLYMAVLWPAAIGEMESYVLFRDPSTAYTQNRGLDTNADGVITKTEASSKVAAQLVKGLKVGNIG